MADEMTGLDVAGLALDEYQNAEFEGEGLDLAMARALTCARLAVGDQSPAMPGWVLQHALRTYRLHESSGGARVAMYLAIEDSRRLTGPSVRN